MKYKNKNMYYYQDMDMNYSLGRGEYVWWKKILWLMIMIPIYISVIPICLIGYGISRLIDKIFKKK